MSEPARTNSRRTPRATVLPVVAVLAIATIPISRQFAEAKRLRSEIKAIETPAGDAGTTQPPSALQRKRRSDGADLPRTTRTQLALLGNERSDVAGLPNRRTAASLLDELDSPIEHQALVKQVMASTDPSREGEEPWGATIAFAKLTQMSKDELAEFFNAFDDYPAPAHLKRLAKHMMRIAHPGTVESHQDTLERMMRGGKDSSLIDSMTFWIREDPDAAIAWFQEKTANGEILGAGLSTKFEAKTFGSLVATLAKSRPLQAIEMFAERPMELRTPEMIERTTRNLAEGMIESGDDTYVRQMFEHHDRSEVLRITLSEYGRASKFGEGMAFIGQFVTDPEERAGYRIRGLSEQDDYSAALDETRNLEDPTLRAETRERVARAWLRHNDAEATQQLPPSLLNRIQNQ